MNGEPSIPTATSNSVGRSPKIGRETSPHARIVALMQGDLSKHRFLSGALRIVAEHFRSPYAALHIRFSSEVHQDDWHMGSGDPAFWKCAVQEFLTDSLAYDCPHAKLLKSKSETARVALVSSPIVESATDRVLGAFALVIASFQEDRLSEHLTLLEGLSRLTSLCMEVRESRRNEQGKRKSEGPLRGTEFGTPVELAFTIVNELRNKIACEQVALSRVSARHVRMLAVSGLDELNRRGPGVLILQAAMEECLDAGDIILSQREGGADAPSETSAYRLHKQWHVAARGDGVASLPLRAGEQIIAILSLRRSPARPFTREELEIIRSRVESYAPTLMLLHRAARGLPLHARDAIHETAGALLRPGRTKVKIITALMTAAALCFVFGTMPYAITAPCVVAPDGLRHVASPFDGVLISSDVLEGDRVRSGDRLCELDTRDLRQQRAELRAQADVLDRKIDRAMAVESPADAGLARAEKQLVQTRIEMLDRRIAQSSILAPFDGIILAGDLRKAIGAVVRRGDPLFQIAPVHGWKVEISIPGAIVSRA